MIEISAWLDTFLNILDTNFGNRVWFVGLQGSYGRDEATAESDIDMVVILDKLTPADLIAYREMAQTLPHWELLCGFLSGKEELLNWEPADLFQFYHDTTSIRGSLDALLPLLDDTAVIRAIKTGACNIYHGCVHNLLYDRSADILRGLYKGASFVIQAICFRQTGTFTRRQKDLLALVSPEDRVIFETFLKLKEGGDVDFQAMSEALFTWAQRLVNETR